MTDTQFAWLCMAAAAVAFVSAFPAVIIWALNNGHGRWVAATTGLCGSALVVLISIATRR